MPNSPGSEKPTGVPVGVGTRWLRCSGCGFEIEVIVNSLSVACPNCKAQVVTAGPPAVFHR